MSLSLRMRAQKSIWPSLIGAFVLTLALTTGRDAHANGRFPYANQLVVNPNDPNTILVRTTFGLLLSADGGKTFQWVCEQIIGFTNGQDPGIAVFGDGSFAVAGFYGLAMSHDNACSFPFIGGGLDKQYVIDVAVEKKAPASAVALTATQHPDGTSFVQVFDTSDNGTTWSAAGVPLRNDFVVTTIEIAPSRPQRIYVAGLVAAGGVGNGFVVASDDNGATWSDPTLVPANLYLSAVDPVDPDLVYVRGLGAPNDELFVSFDGAKTLTSVLTITGSMRGFALSPDGSKIAIGGPEVGTLLADRVTAGEAGTDAGLPVFATQSTKPINCLTWTPDAMYACGQTMVGGDFVVARSTDVGVTWTPLLKTLQDIAGTYSRCAPGTPYAQLCISDWPRQQCLFEHPGSLCTDGGAADGGGDGAGPVTPAALPGDTSSCSTGPLGAGAPLGAMGALALVIALRKFSRKKR